MVPLVLIFVVKLIVPEEIVPTLVKLEAVTVEFNVVPVRVPAFAIAEIVISALPSNGIPLIFFVVANFDAVAALPVIFI